MVIQQGLVKTVLSFCKLYFDTTSQLEPWPHVHKETKNEDQAQDQTYKLQLLDKKNL